MPNKTAAPLASVLHPNTTFQNSKESGYEVVRNYTINP